MGSLVERLAGCEVFGELSASARAVVASAAESRRLGAGELLFRAGDPRRAVWAVLDGQVEIRAGGPALARVLIVLGPGEVVGEAAFLDGGHHTTTARVLEPCEVAEIPADSLRKQVAGDAGLALEITAALARSAVRRLRFSAARSTAWSEVYASGRTRRERDLLGERDVPEEALYGIQTLRAVENFPITGIRVAHFPAFVRALAMVKQAAARANCKLGLLPERLALAIDRACQEVIDGHWHGHFVVDVVQGGAGTSTNMNANEVIANRALELLGHARGDYRHCHPNTHVNRSQSTNDVYPTAVRLAALMELDALRSALERLADAFQERARTFADVVKIGRTQLQDAVPMTAGQELGAYAVTIREDVARLGEAAELLREVNLGGTAIGTGITADPRYPQLAVDELTAISGIPLRVASDLVEATPDTGAFVAFSGVLKRTAVKLSKIASDLRLLASGPRAGIGEYRLPPVQPGSSIMPGKVNPVIPEVVNQVAFAVTGFDLAITMAAEAGQLQLNAMEPVIAWSLFNAMGMLTAAAETFADRCVRGLEADANRCRELLERSIGVVTALVPVLGYETASEIAREALERDVPVRELVLQRGLLQPQELDRLLAAEAMTRPQEPEAE